MMNNALRRNLAKNRKKTAKAVNTYGDNLKTLLEYNLWGIVKAKVSVKVGMFFLLAYSI